MSRSRKKTPAGTIVSCKSQKRDKQICNRLFRHQTIDQTIEAIKRDKMPPIRLREVKNSWTFSGEAKVYFGFKCKEIERLMRK